MVDKTIDDLTTDSTPDLTTEFETERGGQTYKNNLDQLRKVAPTMQYWALVAGTYQCF